MRPVRRPPGARRAPAAARLPLALPALLLFALVALTAGCGGRSLSPLRDLGAEGPTPPGSACGRVALDRCDATPGCRVLGCPPCRDGAPDTRRCGSNDEPAATCQPCTEVVCASLEEAACAKSDRCERAYCPSCDGQPIYFACHDRGQSPPGCPDQRCPPECGSAQAPETCLALATLGCKPHYCPTCDGDRYEGCLGPLSTPPRCPAVVCPPGCRTALDCTSGQTCLAPGADPGCGTCQPAEPGCASDTDCAMGDICEPIACACQGELACVPGCQDDADCGVEAACGKDGRCGPRPCGKGPGQCPTNFVCSTSPAGQPVCTRRSCQDDTGCEVGFCVEGRCYAEPGTCVTPPA